LGHRAYIFIERLFTKDSDIDMKTRQSPRRGNLGSALSSYSEEQQVKAKDAVPVPPNPPAISGANHPGQSIISDSDEPMTQTEEEKPSATEAATVVSDTAGRSGSIDFRSRSDTFGSLGITLDDFRGRSETLGSAADVLADCLGPFPSVLDVNIQALPPDQRQVYSANQAQALHQQYQAALQSQQQVPTSEALPVPKQIGGGGGGGSNPGSQPSSHGSASGFLSQNFGSATKKVTAGGDSKQKIPAGGIAHTPPSGPTSYEAKHFGKRMRAGVSLYQPCLHTCIPVGLIDLSSFLTFLLSSLFCSLIYIRAEYIWPPPVGVGPGRPRHHRSCPKRYHQGPHHFRR